MSVVSVKARSFILALFIRDDGERFLLGDNGYDFKDSQLHFAANTIENDEVQKQGADGVMVAGQVRRASVQSFDGFVGDATMAKETIEQMRRDFFAFFVKGYHFRVVYIDCNRNAWQRKGGYLVDAPEVKELWQIHPEYHVGLNFEDVNYYSYDEDADGEEILSNLVDVPVSTAASGGLVWDEDGAVSEDAEVEYDTETADASGKAIAISDAAEAPLASFQLDGETSQNGTPTPSAPVPVQTVTGENVVKICGKNLFDVADAQMTVARLNSTGNITTGVTNRLCTIGYIKVKPNTAYTLGATPEISGKTLQAYIVGYSQSGSSTGIGNYPSNAWYGFPITFTTGSNCKYIRISYRYSDDSNMATTSATNQQLELGSTATAYQAYQGQSYEINLGKNLFDKNNASGLFEGYISGGKSWAASGYWSYYAPCKPNTTYTASRTNIGNGGRFAIATSQAVPANNVDVAQLTQDNTVTSLTITTNSSAKYIIVWFANVNDAGSESLADWEAVQQLEKGSQATSYAPYFTPIELCGLGDDGAGGYLYKDGIYKNLTDNKWYMHAEVAKIACADISWTWDSTVPRLSYNASSLGAAGPSDVDTAWLAYSNKFKAYSFNYVYTRKNTGMAYSPSGFINLADTTWADAESAVASVQDCSIYYALATPTDTEITNEALIEQLETLLTTVRTYAGTNNIFTVTPNEQGTLEISYYTKYQPIVTGGGYVWEAGGAGGATIVVNNSIDNVNPIWKIYGPTMNPQLENSTTGEVIEYVGLIAEGQTLTIDMGEQTASLDGLNVISNLVGDFISLAPGANRLIYSVSGDAGASEIGWSEIVG